MHDAQGVGLAATQVGLLQRLFVFELEGDGPQAVVNPRLVDVSDETETDEEGCLSLEGVRVPVERATKVTLEGADPSGERGPLRARGPRRARRAARARPPRRRADHRPHRRRAPQGGAREAAAADRPEVDVRVAVAATAPFGADVLERLAAGGTRSPTSSPGPTRRAAAAAGSRRRPAKETADRLGIPVLQPERPELPDRPGRRRRRLRLRPADPRRPPRAGALAQRPPLAAAALARRRARRAGDPRR